MDMVPNLVQSRSIAYPDKDQQVLLSKGLYMLPGNVCGYETRTTRRWEPCARLQALKARNRCQGAAQSSLLSHFSQPLPVHQNRNSPRSFFFLGEVWREVAPRIAAVGVEGRMTAYSAGLTPGVCTDFVPAASLQPDFASTADGNFLTSPPFKI